MHRTHSLSRARVALTATVLMLAALPLEARAQQPSPNQPAAAAPRRRGDRSRLTRADIDEAGGAIVTARDAIRVLRPQWLAPPVGRMASSNVGDAGGGATAVVVYIDDMRQPDLESLITVPNATIVEMRYLDQNRAISMRGPGHEAGVIEVTTTSKRK